MFLKQLIDLEKQPLAAKYGGAVYDLTRYRAVLDSLGLMDNLPHFIHVAGTKGKGSTCAMAEAILRASGFSTAQYSSPHINHYGERFRIDGVPLTEKEFHVQLEAFATRHDLHRANPFQTVFEVMTAFALDLFRQSDSQRQRIVLWETGLGGRLDCTNVVTPLVTILTTMGMDHVKQLGPTIEAIAGEKAGIMKSQVPCVLGRQTPEFKSAVESVVFRRAEELRSQVIRAADFTPASLNSGGSFQLRLPDDVELEVAPSLSGSFQQSNIECAIAGALIAADRVEHMISAEAIVSGLATTDWPGRFEIHRAGDHMLIIDGAHCPLSARSLSQAVAKFLSGKPSLLVWSMQKDKDMVAFLKGYLAGGAETAEMVGYHAPGSRAASQEQLHEALHASGAPFRLLPSLEEAMKEAIARNLPIIAAGTIYTAGEVRSLFDKFTEPE